MTVLLLFI